MKNISGRDRGRERGCSAHKRDSITSLRLGTGCATRIVHRGYRYSDRKQRRNINGRRNRTSVSTVRLNNIYVNTKLG